jgi:predicted small lipoprotein YifL
MRGWALILALALAGCGKKKPPEAPANSGAKEPAKDHKEVPDDKKVDSPGGGGADEDPCAGGK